MNNIKICSKCIMDTTDPNITFDELGVCNHCRAYEEKSRYLPMDDEKGKTQLLDIIQEIKEYGKNNEYDCIIGLSGGVDSTYVAYLVKKYGLRPIAIHLDNGWNSELAVSNINNIVEILGIDLYTHVIDWEEFKDLQLAFLKASVVDIEVLTDHAITAILYKLARKLNIKYIISGANIATEGVMPESWNYYKGDFRNIKSIHHKFGKLKMKTFPKNSLFNELYVRFIRRIQTVKILNFISYNKVEAISMIEKELHWRNYGGKHYESTFTKFYQAYILPEKFNIDKRKPHFSSLINSGQMLREEALALLDEPLYPEHELKEEKEFVLKKFGLSEEQFEQIMSSPPKNHTDYPSNVKAYNFLRKMQRKFKQY